MKRLVYTPELIYEPLSELMNDATSLEPNLQKLTKENEKVLVHFRKV